MLSADPETMSSEVISGHFIEVPSGCLVTSNSAKIDEITHVTSSIQNNMYI